MKQKRDRDRDSQPRPRPRLDSQPHGATKDTTATHDEDVHLLRQGDLTMPLVIERLQGTAPRGRQVYRIFAVLQTLFSWSKFENEPFAP